MNILSKKFAKTSNKLKIIENNNKLVIDNQSNKREKIIFIKSIKTKDGKINIKGIQADTYYLKEIEAPNGYNFIRTPIKIVVTSDTDGKGVVKVDNDVVDQVNVLNNYGSLLPSTGGMGTTLIYAIGCILVLSSGVVLFLKRRTK